jgi:hypothetical protein
MTTVDVHPHIISSDLVRYPRAPLGGRQSDWSATRPVSLEAMIAAMDSAGIGKAAIVQASTCYGHDNSYVADAVAAYPQRFTGVFSADVLAPDAPQGMRLFTFGSTMSEQASWLDDPKSYPAWSYAAERGLSICMQMSVDARRRGRRNKMSMRQFSQCRTYNHAAGRHRTAPGVIGQQMSNPMQMWNAWFALSSQAARLGWEAQNVMALRFMRLAGGGAGANAESRRMVTEKVAAFAEAQAAAAQALILGGDHNRVAEKVLAVYQKRVGGNRRRLTK